MRLTREHKSHWLFGIVVLLLPDTATSVNQLRTGSRQNGLSTHALPPQESEWTAKNIIGLTGAILVLVFLFLSFVFSEQFRRRVVKMRVMQVAVVSENETDDTHSFTAVIKVNSDNNNPLHYVIPVDKELCNDPAKMQGKCVFDIEEATFESVSFSLIIRSGNIPIHFETISGAKMSAQSESISGSKKLRKLNIDNKNVHDDRLLNKQIVLLYEINK
jgi:hypothetical protein